jgi:hypothetical protein
MPGMPMKTIPALALVEDRSQLFEAVHLQPVGDQLKSSPYSPSSS